MTQPTSTSPAFDRLEIGTVMSSRGRTIGEADLTSFAALTGDWHPQHADAEWAAAGPFGERIAHGMLVLSYAFGLLPIDPERVVALRSVRRVVFKRPVAIGTTIIAEAEVASLRPLDDEHGLVELALRVRGAEDRIVARGLIEVLWRREPDDLVGRSNGALNGAAELDLSPLADGRVLA